MPWILQYVPRKKSKMSMSGLRPTMASLYITTWGPCWKSVTMTDFAILEKYLFNKMTWCAKTRMNEKQLVKADRPSKLTRFYSFLLSSTLSHFFGFHQFTMRYFSFKVVPKWVKWVLRKVLLLITSHDYIICFSKETQFNVQWLIVGLWALP